MESGQSQYSAVRSFVFVFIRFLMVLGTIVAYTYGRDLIFVLSVFGLVFTFVPFLLRRFFSLSVPIELEVIVLLFVYGLFLFAKIQGFYAGLWWLAILFAFCEGVILSFVALSILYALEDEEVLTLSPVVILFFVFAVALSLGVIWELFEFCIDTFFGFGLQYGTLANTMVDLFVIAIAALFVAEVGCHGFMRGNRRLFSGLLFRALKRHAHLFRATRDDSYYAAQIARFISLGEGPRLEFKSSVRKNLHTGVHDKRIEHSLLKTVTGFLNTNGGTLLVGVSDTGSILGLSHDDFASHDQLRIYLTGLFRTHLGNQYLSFISFEVYSVRGHDVLKITCTPSRTRVFLRWESHEEFYVRHGSSTLRLEGSDLLDYVAQRFR